LFDKTAPVRVLVLPSAAVLVVLLTSFLLPPISAEEYLRHNPEVRSYLQGFLSSIDLMYDFAEATSQSDVIELLEQLYSQIVQQELWSILKVAAERLLLRARSNFDYALFLGGLHYRALKLFVYNTSELAPEDLLNILPRTDQVNYACPDNPFAKLYVNNFNADRLIVCNYTETDIEKVLNTVVEAGVRINASPRAISEAAAVLSMLREYSNYSSIPSAFLEYIVTEFADRRSLVISAFVLDFVYSRGFKIVKTDEEKKNATINVIHVVSQAVEILSKSNMKLDMGSVLQLISYALTSNLSIKDVEEVLQRALKDYEGPTTISDISVDKLVTQLQNARSMLIEYLESAEGISDFRETFADIVKRSLGNVNTNPSSLPEQIITVPIFRVQSAASRIPGSVDIAEVTAESQHFNTISLLLSSVNSRSLSFFYKYSEEPQIRTPAPNLSIGSHARSSLMMQLNIVVVSVTVALLAIGVARFRLQTKHPLSTSLTIKPGRDSNYYRFELPDEIRRLSSEFWSLLYNLAARTKASFRPSTTHREAVGELSKNISDSYISSLLISLSKLYERLRFGRDLGVTTDFEEHIKKLRRHIR